MYKKLLVSAAILVFSIFSFTLCLANDATNMLQNATNGVRNVVGGAENVMENAAGGVSNTAKNVTNGMEKGTKNVGNTMSNTMTSNSNTGYNATRTSTGAATFMGMTSTAWTWLIMGIAGIAIVALVWYYATQKNTSNYDDR